MARSEETNRRKTETTRLNRLARRALMTPGEREAEAEREFERRAAAARKAWRTRRARAGLPPGKLPPSKPVQLLVGDIEELARLVPWESKPKGQLHELLRRFRELRIEC